MSEADFSMVLGDGVPFTEAFGKDVYWAEDGKVRSIPAAQWGAIGDQVYTTYQEDAHRRSSRISIISPLRLATTEAGAFRLLGDMHEQRASGDNLKASEFRRKADELESQSKTQL